MRIDYVGFGYRHNVFVNFFLGLFWVCLGQLDLCISR